MSVRVNSLPGTFTYSVHALCLPSPRPLHYLLGITLEAGLHWCILQEFDGQAAYAPFHEAAFKQRLTQAAAYELDLMQQMLDWREGEIHNEIRLLDAAEDGSQGKRQPMKLCYLPW